MAGIQIDCAAAEGDMRALTIKKLRGTGTVEEMAHLQELAAIVAWYRNKEPMAPIPAMSETERREYEGSSPFTPQGQGWTMGRMSAQERGEFG